MFDYSDKPYTTKEIAWIAMKRWPDRFSDLDSAVSTICGVIKKLGLKDCFDPNKKQNRQFSCKDVRAVLQYLEDVPTYYAAETFIPFDDSLDSSSEDTDGNWWEPTVCRTSTAGKSYVKISIQKKDTHSPRLTFALHGDAYKSLFDDSRSASIRRVDKNTLVVIPTAVPGVLPWRVSVSKGGIKFAPTMPRTAVRANSKFEGIYFLEEIKRMPISLDDGSVVTGWVFHAKGEGNNNG